MCIMKLKLIFPLLLISIIANAAIKDSLSFSGQLSNWENFSFSGDYPITANGRYIPTLDYSIYLKNNHLIDFEGAINAVGTVGVYPFDSIYATGSIKPYRAWARYSASQYELRAGLQKISFGSANMLRPLMWFDQIDPRDPLQLTNGVWALLGRYYFLNNANIWAWILYDNKQQRVWDIGTSSNRMPELGGRIQYPTPKGEIGLSYNYRKVDMSNVGVDLITPENRVGVDGKWDVGVGLWFEGAWIGKTKDVGALTNQELMTVGVDYTFGIGNGLYAVIETMMYATDQTAFAFENNGTFTACTLSYPIGMTNNLSTILYYDWKNADIYTFVNWKKDLRHNFTFYAMGYWNPERYNLPQQGGTNANTSFTGKGIQLMIVWNH